MNRVCPCFIASVLNSLATYRHLACALCIATHYALPLAACLQSRLIRWAAECLGDFAYSQSSWTTWHKDWVRAAAKAARSYRWKAVGGASFRLRGV